MELAKGKNFFIKYLLFISSFVFSLSSIADPDGYKGIQGKSKVKCANKSCSTIIYKAKFRVYTRKGQFKKKSAQQISNKVKKYVCNSPARRWARSKLKVKIKKFRSSSAKALSMKTGKIGYSNVKAEFTCRS